MSWEEINNERITYSTPVIRVDKKNASFIFFSVFARQAEIEKKRFLRIYVDEKSQQISFEFSDTEEVGSYKVSVTNNYYSVRSQPSFKLDIVQEFANFESGVFQAQKLSKRWVISLRNEKVTDFSSDRWKLIKSANRKKNGYVLTINNGRLNFSKDFAKEAELEKKKFVLLKFDKVERKIGFVFYRENIDGKLLQLNGNLSDGFYVQNKKVNDLEWVKSVNGTLFNDFNLLKVENTWVAQLCPAFEISVLREDIDNIPTNAKGIYRYLCNGEVVYVGRGWIRNRFNDTSRIEWEFDEIQYSVIEDEVKRSEWEDYWIKYYEELEGRIPKLNKIYASRLNKKSEN